MQRFKNILFVVTADYGHSKIAYERALAIANNNQARLTVITILSKVSDKTKLPSGSLSSKEFQAMLIAESKQRLEKLVISSRTELKVKTKVLAGIPFIEITREVLRDRYDLVIKAVESDGEKFVQAFGSNDMHLLRKCPCPVLLNKSTAEMAYHRVLASVDVYDYYPTEELNERLLLNAQILELAGSMALSESAEFHIVSAWEAVGESMMQGGFMQSSDTEVADFVEDVRQQNMQKLNALMNELNKKLGSEAVAFLEPKKHLVKGRSRVEIPDFANKINADLVVMGTVGRTGIPGFIMGNTAEAILNKISCSVLAIKPEGFKTPVTLEN